MGSYRRMQCYPVYVCARTMRDVYLQILRQYAAGELPEGFYLCNVVLRTNDDGTAALDCFGSRGLLKDYMEQLTMMRKQSAAEFELKGLVESCSAHASQYCQARVLDWQGCRVLWDDREVLDPAYLSREVDKLDKLGCLTCDNVEHLLQNAPEIPLTIGDWRNRSAILRWQTRLNWWRKRGESPFKKSTTTVALEA